MRTMALLLSLAGCGAPPDAPEALAQVDRVTFNRLAVELGAPYFWAQDRSFPGILDQDEVVRYWSPWLDGEPPVQDGAFTASFLAVYREIVEVASKGHAEDDLTDDERRRRQLVRRELANGRPTLLLTELAEGERVFVGHMLDAAAAVERLHQRQIGSFGMLEQVTDPSSRSLFARNHGPWCEGATTESDPDCNAIASRPAKISGLYPADIQVPGFCTTLDESLLTPFTAVVRDGEALKAVPYSQAWPEDTRAASDALRAAAAALPEPEVALRRYLEAAAEAFVDDDWFAADAAWAEMNAENSRWYLRVGPDETYFEPCSRKAGFHMVLARVNPDSARWRSKLEPVKLEMEQTLAAMAGPPYEAREVAFDLPEFIDIVVNAGDARSATGATIGQSLPNWGPVADAGGRTVAMTNLFNDPDSVSALKQKVQSLVCPASLALWSESREPLLVSTVLHEVAHNLGPAHEYAVRGKADGEIFGGPLASMLEELKSQQSALYLSDWLAGRGVLSQELATQAHVADIVWSFGKIADGMYTADGGIKAYSQLSAIELGWMIDHGALAWDAEQAAANGSDTGCFEVQVAGLSGAIESLEREVLRIKATGDRAAAEALVAKYVDGGDDWATLRGTIAERWQRGSDATVIYAVR